MHIGSSAILRNPFMTDVDSKWNNDFRRLGVVETWDE